MTTSNAEPSTTAPPSSSKASASNIPTETNQTTTDRTALFHSELSKYISTHFPSLSSNPSATSTRQLLSELPTPNPDDDITRLQYQISLDQSFPVNTALADLIYLLLMLGFAVVDYSMLLGSCIIIVRFKGIMSRQKEQTEAKNDGSLDVNGEESSAIINQLTSEEQDKLENEWAFGNDVKDWENAWKLLELIPGVDDVVPLD
ncbi:hypothetical protein BKA69DRAFT_1040161 [Paraphysoderma sedebokerense]|nr:hypothetical protein BKA69DRAFT_1040161 [Paraphysoderma sedebokerense]